MDAKIIEEVQTRYILHWNYRYSNLRSKKYQVNSYLFIVKNQIIVVIYTKIIQNSNVDPHFLVEIPFGPSMMEQPETSWKPGWWVFIKNTKSVVSISSTKLFFLYLNDVVQEILLICSFFWLDESWILFIKIDFLVFDTCILGDWLVCHLKSFNSELMSKKSTWKKMVSRHSIYIRTVST